MYMFFAESVLQGIARGMFEVIMDIKIIGLKDQILLLLQLGDGDISRLTFSHPSPNLRSLLMHV